MRILLATVYRLALSRVIILNTYILLKIGTDSKTVPLDRDVIRYTILKRKFYISIQQTCVYTYDYLIILKLYRITDVFYQ